MVWVRLSSLNAVSIHWSALTSETAHVLVDAAQLVAHRKIEMEQCGIDYLAFSAHKVYAPFGSGALVVRKGLLNFGPAQLERIKSSGEENVGGIAALGKARVLLQRIGLDVIQAEERALTQRALRGLAQIPGLKIYGMQDPDSPRFSQRGGVIVFSLKKVPHNLAAKELARVLPCTLAPGCSSPAVSYGGTVFELWASTLPRQSRSAPTSQLSPAALIAGYGCSGFDPGSFQTPRGNSLHFNRSINLSQLCPTCALQYPRICSPSPIKPPFCLHHQVRSATAKKPV